MPSDSKASSKSKLDDARAGGIGYQIRLLCREMTASELKRKPAGLGCTFEQGTRHLVVYYKGKRTLMPRHPSQEIKAGTYHGILKRLGIRE
jgi:mRNA interferase HicA